VRLSSLYLLIIRVLTRPRDLSSRPWSFFIIFYVLLILAAAALPFILGRVINISTRLEHQSGTYTETTILGDLSDSDIAAARAQLRAFTVGLPWCQLGEPYLTEHRIMCALGP
jgi:hypothetical protein